MKEIKFRLWSDTLKVMYTPDMEVNMWEVPSMPNGVYSENSTDTLIQYTGLKDSKGQEEYFGYLIKERDGTIRQIVDGCSAVLFKDIKTGDIKYFWELQPHEVIGNRFENPELLEK